MNPTVCVVQQHDTDTGAEKSKDTSALPPVRAEDQANQISPDQCKISANAHAQQGQDRQA